eukprot:jgi/Tetstr1/430205/TSEL_020034.t1
MPRTLGMDGLVPSSPRQRGRARPGSAAGSMYDSDPHSQDNLLNMAWLEKLQQMDPEKVTDWDELEVDINLKQVFQEVGLTPVQAARLIKACNLQRELDLANVTLSDIGSLGLRKLAERRFSHILSAYSRGQPVFKSEDSTKALNQLVMAGEKKNLQLVRDIIRSHYGNNVGVQQQACVIVRTMVAREEEFRAQAGELGLLTDMHNAMQKFPESAGVQKQAMGAVWNMVAGSSRNQDLAGRIGLLADLQTAMQNFEGHAEVQKMACGALWQMSIGHSQNKSRAGKQGLLVSLQTAMRRHPTNIEVQREACGAIRTLTSDNAMNKRIAGKIELLAELQSAMSLHIADPEILKETCGAAWIVIAGNNDIRRWAGEHKLLADLQMVLRAYPRHLELQKQLCACLLHIVTHDLGNKVQAGELGLLADLKALLEGSESVEIQVTALSIASHICHHCKENKELAKACQLLDLADRLSSSDRTTLAKTAKSAYLQMKLFDCMPTLEEITIPREDIPKISIPAASIPAILSGRRRRKSWQAAIAKVKAVNAFKGMVVQKENGGGDNPPSSERSRLGSEGQASVPAGPAAQE